MHYEPGGMPGLCMANAFTIEPLRYFSLKASLQNLLKKTKHRSLRIPDQVVSLV